MFNCYWRWWIWCDILREWEAYEGLNAIWMMLDMTQAILWIIILWMGNVNWIMGILWDLFLTLKIDVKIVGTCIPNWNYGFMQLHDDDA